MMDRDQKNRVNTSVYLKNVEDLEVLMTGDKIHLFSPDFSLYIHIDEINRLIGRIGDAMMSKTPKRLIQP